MKKTAVEILLVKAEMKGLPEKRLLISRNLGCVDLIWPKSGTAKKSAAREFVYRKGKCDFHIVEDGEEKVAKLFFTLAACNPDEHLNNIQQLMGIFMNEELLDALIAAETAEDILAAEIAHPIEEM